MNLIQKKSRTQHAALAVAVFLGAQPIANSAPPPADPPDTGPVPLIVIDDVPLSDALRNLARQSDQNYILDPRIGADPEPSVSLRQANDTVHAAMSTVLQQHQLTWVTNAATSIARIAPSRLHVKPVPASQVGTNNGVVIPLMTLDNVPLSEAIAKLAGAAQLHQ